MLPVLIAAGVVGAGAGAVVGWLPALAVVLAVLAAGTWWLGQRRRSCTCAPKTAAREAELREAARVAARADELQALRELGTLEQPEPREGDEAARDELTRRAGSYVQKDVDAWFAHGLAAHLGHYADPAVRAAAADLLPTHLLAHAALLTELAHVAPGAGGRPAGVRGTALHRRPRGHRRPRRVPRPRPARAELISPSQCHRPPRSHRLDRRSGHKLTQLSAGGASHHGTDRRQASAAGYRRRHPYPFGLFC